MKPSKTVIYKIIKSTWGIWIKITAKVAKANVSAIPISNHIYLKKEIKKKNIVLNETELDYLTRGLKWISDQIEEQIQQPISIIIEEIQIIYCDYQEEGLFYAIASWAAEYFKFKLPTYQYEFNKTKNRYEFPDL